MAIKEQRLRLALDSLDSSDGILFERYANRILVPMFPDLRPVGGMHDGGIDAYIWSPDGETKVFIQHSVTDRWEDKIRRTLSRLRDNKHVVHQLVYCSPRKLANKAYQFSRKLRQDESVLLDIRDQDWFILHSNYSSDTMEASEELANAKVDPLLAEREVTGSAAKYLEDKDESSAAAYLQLMISERDASKGLTKLCFDSLVTYSLRYTNKDTPIQRNVIHERIHKILPSHAIASTSSRVDGALDRLVKTGDLKHHTKDDSYCLSHRRSLELRDSFETMASVNHSAISDIEARIPIIAQELGITFELPVRVIAEDTIRICESYLLENGRSAARAISNADGLFFSNRDSVDKYVQNFIKSKPIELPSLDTLGDIKFLDIVAPLSEDILRTPTEATRRRLSNIVDAYSLFFMLRETPDVQKAMKGVLGDVTLLLDASIVIPCLFEIMFPKQQRQVTALLSAAKQYGIRLVINNEFATEVVTHLQNSIKTYNNYKRYRDLDRVQEIVAVFLATSSSNQDFEQFIGQFIGERQPVIDILDYLKERHAIEYIEFDDDKSQDEHVEREALLQAWKKLDKKERIQYMESSKFDLLARHDVDAIMAIRSRRRRDNASADYGYRWWWLTLDRRAFRVDSELRREAASVCMSPDYFVRFLSIKPDASGRSALRDRLPLCIELANLELIAAEFHGPAKEALSKMSDAPRYMRRRVIRDHLNKAREGQ